MNFLSHPIITSLSTPVNLALLSLILLTIYALNPTLPNLSFLPSTPTAYNWRPPTKPQSIKWRTFTPIELAKFDGTATKEAEEGAGMLGLDAKGRILFAIRRRIYDVSSGRSFYGPGGPYGNFAGRDASRGLAKQSFDADMLTGLDQPIDALSDLTPSEWSNLIDWEGTFQGKYIPCGDLIDAI